MHNLSMMTFPSPPTRVAPVAHKFVWPQRAPKVDPSRPESSSQQTDFLQIPKILRACFRCMTSFTSPSPNFLYGSFILTSVNDTSSPHARQRLCSSLHLTNPCAELKGSQPN